MDVAASPPPLADLVLGAGFERQDPDLFFDRRARGDFLEGMPADEIAEYVSRSLGPETFTERYEGIEESNPTWNAIAASGGAER